MKSKDRLDELSDTPHLPNSGDQKLPPGGRYKQKNTTHQGKKEGDVIPESKGGLQMSGYATTHRLGPRDGDGMEPLGGGHVHVYTHCTQPPPSPGFLQATHRSTPKF